MEKRIKLLNEDIVLRFNMAVQLAFTDVTGEDFSLDAIGNRKAQIGLFMAAILVNNPDTAITLDRLMTEAKSDDFNTLDTAMGELISDWYDLPKRVADLITEDDKKSTKRGGRKQKH